jgi:DNA-binding LacI/PurR family transcriptional regulator
MMRSVARRRSQPTIYEVARRAGVSTATVSRALNGSGPLSPAARAAVDAAVRDLGYRPNKVARSLVTRSTQTLALMLPDITNPFYPGLVAGVQEAARRRGHLVLLCTADGDPDGEATYLDLLRERLVDGALVDGLALRGERLAAIVRSGFPIVSLDRELDAEGVALVRADHEGGARQATEHLLGLGHRRIAHVTGTDGLGITAARLAGYRGALAAAGVKARKRLVAEGDFTEAGGAAAVRRLLEAGERFTAVFAANDLSAVGALRALRECGLRVPRDVSVVGFDDVALCEWVVPSLTTVRQPAGAIGARATELLLDLVAGQEEPQGPVVLPTELVERASTAAPAR